MTTTSMRGGQNNDPRPWEIAERLWEVGVRADDIAYGFDITSKAFTTRRRRKNAEARRRGKKLPYEPRINGK